jgi:hypothetical protein
MVADTGSEADPFKKEPACMAFLILMLLSCANIPSGVNAASGVFSAPYTDNGLDTQGDGYYDYLMLNVSMNITEAGQFNLYGGVYDVGFSTIIAEDTRLQSLPVGISVVTLEFNGADIYSSGIDGPYGVWFDLYDDKWQYLASDSAETSQYNHTDFQHRLAEFSPPHYDFAVDVDGKTYQDHLTVKVNITVDIPAIYEIEGDLFDSSESSWIADGRIQSYFADGTHTVDLRLLGCRIRNAGIDGPFTLQLKMRKDGTQLTSEDTHSTRYYSHTSFDGFSYLRLFADKCASIGKPFRDIPNRGGPVRRHIASQLHHVNGKLHILGKGRQNDEPPLHRT